MNYDIYIKERNERIREGKKQGLNRVQAFFKSTEPTRAERIQALKASLDARGINH